MNDTTTAIRSRYVKLLQVHVSSWLLFSGVVIIGLSLIPGLPAKLADYSKDGGFALVATGLGFLIAEHTLRRESEDLLAEMIQSTLKTALGDVSESARVVERTLNDLQHIREAVVRNAVPDVLRARLGSSDLTVQDSLAMIVQRLYELRQSEHWANDVYREYLTEVIKNTRVNTDALCQLTSEVTPSAHGYGIKLASPAQRTDEILTKLMSKMQQGSKYSVISDVESWTEDNLDDFFKESAEAVVRGVVIRRIFVVTTEDLHTGALVPAAAYEVLRKHLADPPVGAQGEYEVRLCDTTDRTKPILRGGNAGIIYEHFGIFEPAEGRFCVQVKVERTNLSTLTLTNLELKSEDQTRFDDLWRALAHNLTEVDLDIALKRWEEYTGAVSARPG
jgi:hypothetical protein